MKIRNRGWETQVQKANTSYNEHITRCNEQQSKMPALCQLQWSMFPLKRDTAAADPMPPATKTTTMSFKFFALVGNTPSVVGMGLFKYPYSRDRFYIAQNFSLSFCISNFSPTSKRRLLPFQRKTLCIPYLFHLPSP